ncbi:hypothetical protein ALC56_09905, partial [Trachymyrmex septentrionalis]
NLKVPTKLLSYSRNDWICTVSKENLVYPSKNFIKAAEIMNEEFLKFHGNFLNKEDNIFDKLTSIIMLKTNHEFPKEVIACLVRTRTYIRLRKINKEIVESNIHKKHSNL